MKKPLYIYGAGGLGREILSLVRCLKLWEPAGFIDDNIEAGSEISGVKIVGDGTFLKSFKEPAALVLAFGNPLVKRRIANLITNTNVYFPVLIHPSAILQQETSIRIGMGSIICAGCVLTTDIAIHDHVLINLNTTIGHDSHIGNFSSVMPGVNIAGEVNVEEAVLIGAGSNIRNRITIGNESIVGMGSAVIKDVPVRATVAGVPAKPILK